jgi:hypothetical protein
LISCVGIFDNLNAAGFRQFTAGRMGLVGLWIFVRRFMVGQTGLCLGNAI